MIAPIPAPLASAVFTLLSMPAMVPSVLAPPSPSEVTAVEGAEAEGAVAEKEGLDVANNCATEESAVTGREGFDDVDGDTAVGAGFGIA